MYYIGNIAKSVAGLYNQINSATLTGAIDIVVIKQEDGTYLGSPFHVRFGKLGVLRSREKIVDITINGEEVDLRMKLGEAGAAFFVEPVFTTESIPPNLATSPIPSAVNMFRKFGNNTSETLSKEETVHEAKDITIETKLVEDIDEPANSSSSLTKSIPIPGRTDRNHWKYKQEEEVGSDNENLLMPMSHPPSMQYPLSDMDSPLSSPLSMSPVGKSNMRNVYSDTEVDTSPSSPEGMPPQDITWEWGRLPENAPGLKSSRSTSMIVERKKKSAKHMQKSYSEGLLLSDVLAADKEVADMYLNRGHLCEEMDSGFIRESTPVDESKRDENKDDKDETLPLHDEEEEVSEVEMSLCGELKNRRMKPDHFNDGLVTYDQFCDCPSMLTDPKLVVRINNSFYNWAVAGPYLTSHLVFQRNLSHKCLKSLKQQHMPRKRRGWFYWRTPNEESSDDESTLARNPSFGGVRKLSVVDDMSDGACSEEGTEYRKSLRLTSEQWRMLNLNHGANTITFTVITRMQGTATCTARIFLWDYFDKIVISDIDGTITKSDVLGHLLPVIGKDWSQNGVTELFTQIKRNGYKFMYLSARSIGHATLTREYLHSVKQGEMTLPDGPVFLTPTSLVIAFKKEVIERKPEEFKISCMKDIRNLFPKNPNPFYSGFGNKVNDMYAYRNVEIPISRIFTVNYKGEIKHELRCTYTSSYNQLIELVDQVFPPLASSQSLDDSEYTTFSYWRTPIETYVEIIEEEFEFP